jgi:hypothetical protein
MGRSNRDPDRLLVVLEAGRRRQRRPSGPIDRTARRRGHRKGARYLVVSKRENKRADRKIGPF